MYRRKSRPKNTQRNNILSKPITILSKPITILSKPITIPSNKFETEYSFKLTSFDPTKSSPPNSWNNRLMSRINCFDNLGLSR